MTGPGKRGSSNVVGLERWALIEGGIRGKAQYWPIRVETTWVLSRGRLERHVQQMGKRRTLAGGGQTTVRGGGESLRVISILEIACGDHTRSRQKKKKITSLKTEGQKE